MNETIGRPEELHNVDLVGQLISHAHTFGDFVAETEIYAKEVLRRLGKAALPTSDETRKEVSEAQKLVKRYREPNSSGVYDLERMNDAKVIARLIARVSSLEGELEEERKKICGWCIVAYIGSSPLYYEGWYRDGKPVISASFGDALLLPTKEIAEKLRCTMGIGGWKVEEHIGFNSHPPQEA